MIVVRLFDDTGWTRVLPFAALDRCEGTLCGVSGIELPFIFFL
jgi:hypothetical protein